jgi:hypothetical protein
MLKPISRYNYRTGQFILLLLVVYTILFWVFAPRFWHAFGPDFTSYVSISKKYASGNFGEAVNTWWSPAYSWLLGFFSFFGFDALTANKLIQFIAGIAAIFIIRRIIFFHTSLKKDIYAEGCCMAIVPALVWWGLTSDTPDFCSAIVLTWLLLLVLELSQRFSVKTTVLAGFAGALAYLFKSYNFWFVSAFGLLLLFWESVIQQKKIIPVFHQWKKAAAPFLFVSLIWILVISIKNRQLTVSAIAWHLPCTKEYVLQLKPVAAACDCAALQLDSTNLLSNWETPGRYPATPINEFLKTGQDNDAVFIRNARYFFSSFTSRYQLFLMLVLVILLWGFWRNQLYLYAAFWGIYCAGYLLFHLEARFFIMPSLLLMVVICVSFLRISETIRSNWMGLCLLPIMVLMAHSYIYNLGKFQANTVPKQVHEFVQEQKKVFAGKRIAASAGMYDDGLYFAFYTNSRFYGSLTSPEDGAAAMESLRKNNIDYLLLKDGNGNYQLKIPDQGLLP